MNASAAAATPAIALASAERAAFDQQMRLLRSVYPRPLADDIVLIGTPIDLRKLIELDKPALRVTYKLQEIGEPTLKDVLAEKGLLETALV